MLTAEVFTVYNLQLQQPRGVYVDVHERGSARQDSAPGGDGDFAKLGSTLTCARLVADGVRSFGFASAGHFRSNF